MNQRVDFKKIILFTVGPVGVALETILATSRIRVPKHFLPLKERKYNLKYYLEKKTEKLVKDGLLKISSKNERQFLSLTDQGFKKLTYYKETEKKKPAKWDGKWRVVIFDVWEKSRKKRDLLRQEIKNFGFIQLQRSVWIYPYPCEEFIELLKTDLSFGKNLRYMVVEKLDHDNNLKRYFRLK